MLENLSNVSMNINLSGVNVAGLIYPNQSDWLSRCVYTNEAVYGFMQRWPQMAFWFMAVAFLALLLYLYLPIFFGVFRKSETFKQILFVLSIFCVGASLNFIVPLVFKISDNGFKLLGIANGIVIILAVFFAGLAVWKHYKKEKKDKIVDGGIDEKKD